MSQPQWEGVINKEVAIATGTVPHPPGKDVTESLHRDVKDSLQERHLGEEAKGVVEHSVTEKLKPPFQEILYKILHHRTTKLKFGIRSVVYSVLEQALLDQLHNDVIGETLNAHIAKFFDPYAAISRLSKKLLTANSFMASMATFVRCETNTAITDQNAVIAKA